VSRPAPHLPRHLAGRLDRLARGAHAFHRFAHHPLCAAYRDEVIAVGGRARVCRGCALAIAGGLAGAIAGALAPRGAGAWLGGAALLAVVLGAGPHPGITLAGEGDPPPTSAASTRTLTATSTPAPPPRRAPKLLTRFAPAALASAAVVLSLRAATATSLLIALGVAAAAALGLSRYRRRGPDRTPCLACPERALPATCSGLRPIARRERAFRRAAARLVHGIPPQPAPMSPSHGAAARPSTGSSPPASAAEGAWPTAGCRAARSRR
jgi:hypothetical protein